MRLCSASVGHALFQLLDGDVLQQRRRVVAALAPERGIQLAEQARRVVVPAPPQVLRERGQALVRGRDHLAERARLADDRRQLPARHHQHPHLVVAEDARLARLHDQHALQQAAIDHRDTEERVVGVLAGFLEVLEPRVRRRVGEDLRLQFLGHQPDEPFADVHADSADAFRSAARSSRPGPASIDPFRAGTANRRRFRTAAGSD